MNTLNQVNVGVKAKVQSLLSSGLLKERMMALGFTKGALIEVIRKGPKNNLTLYNIRGAMIALRSEESTKVLIEG